MRKRIVSMLTCFTIVFSCALCTLAQDTATNAESAENVSGQTGPKVYTLSLDDAINMAKEKDPGYMSADVKIKDAERQLLQAKTNKKDIEGIAIKVSQGLTSFALQRGYYVKQAEIGVECAKLEKEQTIAKNAYSITQQYYGVKLAERLSQSAYSAYELAKTNLSTVEMQFSLGMVAQLDVNNAKYAVNQAKAACDKYERNLELARKNLGVSLFIEEDNYILNLTDDIEYVEFTTNLEEDIENAMNSRYDIYTLREMLSQAEFMVDIADLYGVNSAEFSSANQSMVQSKVTFDLTKKMIGVSINASYNAIIDARDALLLAEENLSLRQQEYNIAVIQTELGMMTNTQLTMAMNSVTAAQIELDNAKLTYKLAVEKYGYEITIGLPQ